MQDDPDYKIGYKRPPNHSRFAPGVSGNPKGRTKKEPLIGLGETISQQLNSDLHLPELGTIKKKEIVIRKIIQGAIKGSPSDIKKLYQLEEFLKHQSKNKQGHFLQVIDLDD